MTTPAQGQHATVGDSAAFADVEDGALADFAAATEDERWSAALEVLSDPHVPTHIAELASRWA